MSFKTHSVPGLLAGAVLALAGCGGFHSNQPATQVYTLDPVYAQPKSEVASNAPSLLVPRPQAAPGLDSEHIALRRSAQRLDYYAASRWPAPLPEFLQSLAVEALRASGKFRTVQPDRADLRRRASAADRNPPLSGRIRGRGCAGRARAVAGHAGSSQ